MLPTGTVTFLFTDIEGSTRLIQRFGADYARMQGDHRRLIREAVELFSGVEIHTQGDSFFVVFDSAANALLAAAKAQTLLAAHTWPEGGEMTVRMGIHTGQAAVEGDDYVGLDVHRAARISDAGWGGQVLVSEATAAVVGQNLPPGLDLSDLGKHRLKDLAEPETLHQLVIDGERRDFPPLRTLDVSWTNLPVQLTSFVGRDDELATGLRLLRSARILTLTGPGGTGKTRLSLQIAAESVASFHDGAYFVELAPVSGPEYVAPAVLDALGQTPSPNESIEDALVRRLSERSLLLVLDNFEHVQEAADLVTKLAEASGDSKFVVTSRRPLAISGEQEMPVPPLKVQVTAEQPADVMKSEAVRLFVERAAAVRPDFAITEQNAVAVRDLVAHLDGLPLAIELAASMVKVLPPESILERLDLRETTTPIQDLPARQSTLWRTVDWSYQLLSPQEQQLFAGLSVFAGGARLEEIEASLADALEADVLSTLSRLVDQSLVIADGTVPRFRMLQVIREYAKERLETEGNLNATRRAHATTYVGFLEKAQSGMLGADRKEWLDRIGTEIDNVRTALAWAVSEEETDLASRMAFAAWRYWQARGYLVEAGQAISKVLLLHEGSAHWRAKALEAAGGIAWWQNDLESSRQYYGKALDIQREVGEPLEIANALYNLGIATPFYEGSEAGSDAEEAFHLLDEAEAIYSESGDMGGVADVEWGRAGVALTVEDWESMLEWSKRSIDLYEQVGNEFGRGWATYTAGQASWNLGRPDLARTYLTHGLALFYEHGDVSAAVLHLMMLAVVEESDGNMTRAVKLAGAAHQIRMRSGTNLAEYEANLSDGLRYERLERSSGELAAAFQEGKGLSFDDAVAFALAGS